MSDRDTWTTDDDHAARRWHGVLRGLIDDPLPHHLRDATRDWGWKQPPPRRATRPAQAPAAPDEPQPESDRARTRLQVAVVLGLFVIVLVIAGGAIRSMIGAA